MFVGLACKQALHWGISWKVDVREVHQQGCKRRGGGEKGELATITHLFFWVIFVVHCVSLNLQYLGQKVLKILHFLTHRMLILIIWHRYGPSPSTTLVNVVQWRSEMVQPDFNIVLGGKGGGGICSCQCFPELYLDMAMSIFLRITLLSKIVSWSSDFLSTVAWLGLYLHQFWSR